LSNIIDTTTNQVPEYLKSFEVFERAGVRVGVIGLVEKYGRPSAKRIDHLLTTESQRMDYNGFFLAREFPVSEHERRSA